MFANPEPRALNLTPSSTTAAAEVDAAHRREMNEAVFRAFYDNTCRLLFAYLLRVSGNRDLAEDVLQESYCRFLSADVPAMDAAGNKSYLFRIATNLLHDRWRRCKEEPLPDHLIGAEGRDSVSERRLAVRQAFQRLKPRERQLLWLAYVEGSNHKEIAQSTGLRSGSVRLLLFRARRKLAELIRGAELDSDKETSR